MPFPLGNLSISPPTFLAPIAGFTDNACRCLCHYAGAGMVFTEMVSAVGISYNSKGSLDYLDIRGQQGLVSLQLFGPQPKILALAAQRAVQDAKNKFHALNINMGCPAKKVVKNGSGVALMKNPGQVEKIVKTIKSKVNLPLSVKFRSGWDAATINAVEVARAAEAGGADAVIVHPRLRTQPYYQPAHWPVITEVVNAVQIPVIGNGDIDTPQKAVDMMEQTGCQGVMIGRAALKTPWIFSCLIEKEGQLAIKGEFEQMKPLTYFIKHLNFKKELASNKLWAVKQLRKHLPLYLRGFKNAASMRARICAAETFEEIENIVIF